MKSRKTARAIAGVLLCGVGSWLVFSTPLHQRTFLIDAGGCRMVTDIAEPSGGIAKGSVLLLHGLAANKKIMSYITTGFTEQGLRVFVPDLPGHGRTAGPFSPKRADECSEALLRELIARALIDPSRTLLAGHSLGGAIAVRVANRVPVAGVIAISPAPMKIAHGVLQEMLPFSDAAPVPANTIVMSGGWELESMRGNAADLAVSREDGSTKYVVIPRATHSSLLFNSAVVRTSQDWAAHVLHLAVPATMPTRRGTLGATAGFLGLLLLAGPFLRECLRNKNAEVPALEMFTPLGKGRLFLEFAALAIGVVGLLHYWPWLWSSFAHVNLFEGDYFATFLLVLGIALVFFRPARLRESMMIKTGAGQTAFAKLVPVVKACVAAFILLLLVTAWLDLSLTEAWLTAPRWWRFPALLVVLMPYHAAEEIIVGPVHAVSGLRRLLFALLLRLTAWGALAVGVFALHSGEVLMVLLAPYFALFCLLQRRGMDIVREETASPAAAAFFGAILLAGLCLVIFPVT